MKLRFYSVDLVKTFDHHLAREGTFFITRETLEADGASDLGLVSPRSLDQSLHQVHIANITCTLIYQSALAFVVNVDSLIQTVQHIRKILLYSKTYVFSRIIRIK